MTTLREAARQALEALEAMNPYPASKEAQRANTISALRAVLEQPEPEPVAWRIRRNGIWAYRGHDVPGLVTEPLYAAPPQRKPLTDEQIKRILTDNGFKTHPELGDDLKPYCYAAIRAIEAAHGIKDET